MSEALDEKTAVVIGGAGAIGRGIVSELASAGARVLIADLDGLALHEAGRDGTATHPVDVTSPASVQRLADAADAALSGVDVLVNCAGIVRSTLIVDTDPEEWDLVMAINAGGTFLTSRAFLPGMIDRGTGAIINISSINGKQGQAELSAYSASKFAVVGFTQSLAMEVAQHGITANCICPGVVNTPMLEQLLRVNGRTVAQELQELQLIQRPQTPEEIGQVAVFLAAMPSITGQAVNVDGGCVFN